MDRGDAGFILHESFKDLKTRRAEQEAYRKALEEQIMQKRKLQEQEREKFEGRRANIETFPSQIPQRIVPPQAFQTSHFIQPPEGYSNVSSSPSDVDISKIPLHEQPRPTSKGRLLSFNEVDNFNEPHSAAVAAIQTNTQGKSSRNAPVLTTGIPQFSPECMKYLQQVMPGFTLPPPPSPPTDNSDSMIQTATTPVVGKVANQTPRFNGFFESQHGTGEDPNHGGAFSSSSGTSSESSSMEDVSTHAKMKVHVSQTSEQMEGVKVSRKQYREELQRQIDERKRRDEEQRRKAEEEEAKIQEKIRIEQEKMQREYEDELRKQEEREKQKEAEQKRMATLAKQKEIAKAKAKEEAKRKKEINSKEYPFVQNDSGTGGNSNVLVSSSASEESIQSIGEFFDESMMPQGTKIVNPDDRIIPVVAKRLREKVLQKEKSSEGMNTGRIGQDNASLTARIDSAFQAFPLTMSQNEGPPPPHPGLIREMAIRSAPCPSTVNSTDLDFLASLKHYLQNEKSKIDERRVARTSKSTERF